MLGRHFPDKVEGPWQQVQFLGATWVGSQQSTSDVVKRKFLAPVAPSQENEAQEEASRIQPVLILDVLWPL